MDPDTGVFTGREPLFSLRNMHANADGNPLFGVHAIPRLGNATDADAEADRDASLACITVGQEAVVVKRK